jgi:hypothetical protein
VDIAAHLAKGLEFRAVAVMACDDECMVLMATLPTSASIFSLSSIRGAPAAFTAARARFNSLPPRPNTPISCGWQPSARRSATQRPTASHSASGFSKIAISGGGPGFAAAQLTTAHVDVNGIRLPTNRRAYTRGPDRRPVSEMLLVSSDISDVAFSP